MGKKIIFLFMLLSVVVFQDIKANDVTFKASAPPEVVTGTQFQMTYVVNVLNGTWLRISPSISENFDILVGPYKSTSTDTITYTYILAAKKEGTFNVEPATISIGNSEYKSNTLSIKVLPKDKTSQAQGGDMSQQSKDLEIYKQLERAGVGSAAYMFRNEDYRQLVGDAESDRLGIKRTPFTTPEQLQAQKASKQPWTEKIFNGELITKILLIGCIFIISVGVFIAIKRKS